MELSTQPIRETWEVTIRFATSCLIFFLWLQWLILGYLIESSSMQPVTQKKPKQNKTKRSDKLWKVLWSVSLQLNTLLDHAASYLFCEVTWHHHDSFKFHSSWFTTFTAGNGTSKCRCPSNCTVKGKTSTPYLESLKSLFAVALHRGTSQGWL